MRSLLCVACAAETAPDLPRITVDPLPPGCPWSGWTPPNVDWCEEQLCSWVVNPADTWSNLAYLAVGVLMIAGARSATGSSRLFGPAAVVVGVFSLVYHASYTYFFQFFDFAGMFVFCFAVITANALRLGWVGANRQWHFYRAGVAIFCALVPLVGETTLPIQALVALLIAAILGQEAALFLRRRPGAEPIAYAAFGLALVLLAAGGLASLADVTRTICDPTNHWISGHSLWHVLTAGALYALFRFYQQLEQQLEAPRPA
jgi:hypothetical protein